MRLASQQCFCSVVTDLFHDSSLDVMVTCAGRYTGSVLTPKINEPERQRLPLRTASIVLESLVMVITIDKLHIEEWDALCP